MKIRFYIFLFISFHSMVTFSQSSDWTWAKSAGGEMYDYSNSITTDIEDNIYITGSFSSDTMFFGSDYITTDIIPYDGAFIAKYDNIGNLLWAKKVAEGFTVNSNSIISDKNGFIYISGTFGGNLKFDSITLTSNGTSNIFIAKFDLSGNIIYAKRNETPGISQAYENDIVIDNNSNLYVIGHFDDFIGFDSIIVTGISNNDIFLAKFDAAGEIIWVKVYGSTQDESGYSVTSDTQNNIYITGNFLSDTLAFDSDTLFNTLGSDIFITKIDTNGNVIWAEQGGGGEASTVPHDAGYDICSDDQNNVYLTGHINGVTFGSFNAYGSIFIAKYSSSGELNWVRSTGGGSSDIGRSIILDGNGNVFFTGEFYSQSISFGNDTLWNNNSSLTSVFIAKFDTSGTPIYARKINDDGQDSGFGDDHGNGITSDSSGNIYITGTFSSDTIYFGNITLIRSFNDIKGPSDIFVARLDKTTDVIEPEINEESTIYIYPNPTLRDFILIVPEKTKQIQIINSMGQIVRKTMVDNQTNFNLTLSNSGLYFIQALSDKQILTKKIIVTNK